MMDGVDLLRTRRTTSSGVGNRHGRTRPTSTGDHPGANAIVVMKWPPRSKKLVPATRLFGLQTSMPAVVATATARILTEIVGKDFVSAGHLKPCAEQAPMTSRSGASIREEQPPV